MGLHASIETAIIKDVARQLAGAAAADPLGVGEIIVARTGTDATGGRTLMIAGVRIPAVLPSDVDVGRLLRLQVKESDAGRLVFQVLADITPDEAGGMPPAAASQTAATAAALQPQPQLAFALPGGVQVSLWVDPDRSGGPGGGRSGDRSRSMVVRYDSPELGRTDVVLQLDEERLDATVLAQGGSLDLVRQKVPALRLALAAAVERPVALVTGGRGAEDLDVRA